MTNTIKYNVGLVKVETQMTAAYPWCDGHSTSINACGVWGVRAEIQVFRRKFHTHIHLDQVGV